MFSILVLAGSHVVPPQIQLAIFIAVFAVGSFAGYLASVSVALQKMRTLLRKHRIAVGLVSLWAILAIASDVCNFCWWCIECWF